MKNSLDRSDIYYWKCDRPARSHGTSFSETDALARLPDLEAMLEERFPGRIGALRPGPGQGNHLTFRLTLDGDEAFARLEDGPEADNYFEVEYRICRTLAELDVPVPRVLAFDCARTRVPFAWQLLEYLPFPDMNHWMKTGTLDPAAVAHEIGKTVARWQSTRFSQYGPFSATHAAATGELRALHGTYADYFLLHVKSHQERLVRAGFLEPSVAERISKTVAAFRELLDLEEGCLVHKDLALWNMLGTSDRIMAFIDWDDAVSGDPMDDLSLLGCFYDGSVLSRALEGYASVRPLPNEYRRRFWLHLLRNMLVKAVIRVEAGYFDRHDGFFLIDTGASGADLKSTTHARLIDALEGLKTNREIETL